jgi:hypothetical protein
MPHLTADQREFIMTGITADDWLHLFGSADALDREMQDAR